MLPDAKTPLKILPVWRKDLQGLHFMLLAEARFRYGLRAYSFTENAKYFLAFS